MVSIANKLEVKDGNVIQVPGCEPLSELSSLTLAANIDCKSAVITLAAALEAIPGSTIEMTKPKKIYFVLPDGPPSRYGCTTCAGIDDWYQVLREASTPIQPQTPDVAGPCDPFPIPRC